MTAPDCEGSARARRCRADARNEGSFSRVRGHLRVSRVSLSIRTKKKERLLVVCDSPLSIIFCLFICLFCNVTNSKKKFGPSFSGLSSSQCRSCELLMYNRIKSVPRYFLTACTIYYITSRGLHDHKETGKTDAFLKLNLYICF